MRKEYVLYLKIFWKIYPSNVKYHIDLTLTLKKFHFNRKKVVTKFSYFLVVKLLNPLWARVTFKSHANTSIILVFSQDDVTS